MDSQKKYDLWMANDYFDEKTKEELKSICEDKKEIEERFYKELEFGTGGLRGIIGAGTNRMNIYTVRKASQGLANYVAKMGKEYMERGIAIAYDCRHMSYEFARESALVFASNGIKAFLFDELKTTPLLSFAVRYLKTSAGIVITASHNPKEYNGYKVYGKDGAQISIEDSNIILDEFAKIEDITSINVISESEATEKGLFNIIREEVENSYIEKLKELRLNFDIPEDAKKNFKIVFTPLHGTGNKPVRRILKETGFESVLVVKEQELPDPDFSTVKFPNPEDIKAFELAIKLAKKENADCIIGTDPDTDRLGVLVKDNSGEFVVLTGNQTGCLLLHYIASQLKETNKLPSNSFAVKTIVTTEMARTIAKKYDVELIEVLTGFKFIGEQIKLLDEQGDKKYLFGFEESYGYLSGTDVRDKDAVVASMLVAEMAVYYSQKGMNLYDALLELYKEFGYFKEDLTAFTLKGKDGIERINNTISTLRNEKMRTFGNTKISKVRDYKEQKITVFGDTDSTEVIDLPSSNVLYYEVVDGSWFCIRPSGTEPKIKIYYGVSEKDLDATNKKLESLKKDVLGVVEGMLFD